MAQIVSMGMALTLAGVLYARLVLVMRIPEARQIEQLIVSRLPGALADRAPASYP